MKIWTGNFCRITTLVLFAGALSAACASKEHKPAESDEAGKEVSLKSDRGEIEELRKNIPEEIRKDNDRLATVLQRWKIVKTPPERLRELYNDEIRKMREDIDKKQRRMREDFQRGQTDRRHEFQEKQKDERDNLFASKPSSEKRQKVMDHQGEERDRFNSDLRDERDEFDDKLKDERKVFEDDIRDRWTEFRQEFPEYSKLYNEMKAAEEKLQEQREDQNRTNPKPYAGWPYKASTSDGVLGAASVNAAGGAVRAGPGSGAAGGVGGAPAANNPNADVNEGGGGWPSSDPAEFDQLHKPHGGQ